MDFFYCFNKISKLSYKNCMVFSEKSLIYRFGNLSNAKQTSLVELKYEWLLTKKIIK